jgi:hypothetical protein
MFFRLELLLRRHSRLSARFEITFAQTVYGIIGNVFSAATGNNRTALL